ncbi:MAG: GNAT family N-acetyltransferase [Candidatus ainarchaeum sp.]|nr:GNAT family N-acetyltransferase [Candidatus ainarchaeum sp.]
MEISIRRAKPGDMDALAALWNGLMLHHVKLYGRDKRAENHEFRKDAESIWRKWALKNIRSQNGLVLIAEDGGRPVGYSLSLIKPNIPVFRIRKLGHMSDLYIRPGYRGKGIGTRFRDAAFRWFRKKGIRHASIAVHALNPASWKIYRKWGFSDYHMEMRRRL